MKKIVSAIIALISYALAMGQTPEDALRYSWFPSTGTARVQSLGGASGAIGGEISTLFSNPANIGFYKTGDAVISLGGNLNNVKGTYFGTTDKINSSNAFLGTTGFVIGKPSYGNGALRSAAFGIGISRKADFSNKIFYNGVNNVGSMGQMFVQDVKAYNDYNQFGSDLAYRTYWIDSVGGQLISPAQMIISNGGSLLQEEKETSTGGITEFAIGGGLNFNDHVYVGATLGFPSLRYDRTRAFTEADALDNGGFDYGYFEDNLATKGSGINLKVGVVFKPTENMRLGFSAHTPTYFSLTDEYTAYAESKTGNTLYTAASTDNIYTNDGISVSEYRIKTPYQLMGSFSFMFGNMANPASQRGFITGDVEYINYAASSFNSSDNSYTNYFNKLNSTLDKTYRGALNARLGLELKFNTIMARLGGAYYGNPYQNINGEKGNIYQATTGLGYRNRGFFVDLGYVYSFGSDVHFPYRLENANMFQPATLKPSNSRILLTFGFKI